MTGASRQTPAQMAGRQYGRTDIAAMSNADRLAAGLMTRRQAAEHERLATVPEVHLAERSRGSDAEIWGLVFISGHQDCGGWTTDGRDEVVICACGEVLREPAGATP